MFQFPTRRAVKVVAKSESVNPETRVSLLIRICDPRDQHAWGEFVDIYFPVIQQMAERRGLQAADAEDIAQRVLLSVSQTLEKRPHDPNRARFRTWLHRVVENAVLNALTRRKPDQGSGQSDVLDLLNQTPDPRATEELQSEYQKQLFRYASEQIRGEFADTTWQAFWQTTVLGKDSQVVASELNTTVGSIYTARSRVIRRLREKVAEFSGEFFDQQLQRTDD